MIRSLARVIFGFLLACIAAGLTVVLFVTTPGDLVSAAGDTFAERAGQTLIWGLLAATHSAIFSAAFALIATGIAEWLGWRALGYYAVTGIVIAMLGYYAQYSSEAAGQPTILNAYAAAAFLTAGLVGGAVYWLAAGRHAGASQGPEDRPAVKPAAGDRPRIVVETRPETERPKPRSTLADRVAQTEIVKPGAATIEKA